MKKALFLTAYNRPDYLRDALASWTDVRGTEEWYFVAMIEPSPVQSIILHLFQDFLSNIPWAGCEIGINPTRYGVLHHPWVGFEWLFNVLNYDYVVRVEDDLIVSQDILEYHSWAADVYQGDPDIGIVTSFAADNRSPAEVHRQLGLGSPLVIGTWKDRWVDVIGPTWDHDYSTYTGSPMVESGWDWNLNVRVMPSMGLHAIVPNKPKTFHAGIYGEHSTPAIYFVQDPFDPCVPTQKYREVPE